MAIYTRLAIFLTFQIMSVICLLRISFGNPGYVSDYFYSKRI